MAGHNSTALGLGNSVRPENLLLQNDARTTITIIIQVSNFEISDILKIEFLYSIFSSV